MRRFLSKRSASRPHAWWTNLPRAVLSRARGGKRIQLGTIVPKFSTPAMCGGMAYERVLNLARFHPWDFESVLIQAD